MKALNVNDRKAGDFRGDGRAPSGGSRRQAAHGSGPEGIGCLVGGRPRHTGREN